MNLAIDLFRRRLIGRWLKLPPPLNDVRVERNARIPMSDGITLLADHYVPKVSGSLPTVLIRSPWGRDWNSAPFSVMYMFIAQRFAERGYHVVLQDARPNMDAADGGWLVNEGRCGKGPSDHYRYDPSDPTPSTGGPLLDANAVGMCDNRAVEARSDVLCYTSPELEMGPVAYHFQKGHCIRLQVSSGAAIWERASR